jgi:hypothetical protein
MSHFLGVPQADIDQCLFFFGGKEVRCEGTVATYLSKDPPVGLVCSLAVREIKYESVSFDQKALSWNQTKVSLI